VTAAVLTTSEEVLLVFSDSSHACTEVQTPRGWASAFDVQISLINSTKFLK
jgi:hypothetical protein